VSKLGVGLLRLLMKTNAKRTGSRSSIILALALVIGLAGSARAQQGGFTQIPSHPLNQSQGGGVLEVPSMPGPQGGSVDTLPQRVTPGSQGGAVATLPQENLPAPQTGETTIPPRELRSQQGYAQATVTVTQDGRYVTGLHKDDFQLYVDGQKRNIDFFRQDSQTPVSVGILVDTSGSMEPKLPQAEAAITEFMHNLNDQDDVFLIAFSSRPFVLQPFTIDHGLVLNRLGLLHAFGQTSLYDSVIQGLLMVRHGRWDKKALLVITDGMDNTSEETLDEVGAQARRMGVLVYTIGIGDPNASNMPAFGIGPFVLGGDGDRVDAATLNMLSSETGAKTYLFRAVGDGGPLRAACAQISHELRQQYTIGFIAPDASRGGYRNLRVSVPTIPDATVRTRKGVQVGATESASAGGAAGEP
jgi:Ca-activated chloride channel family protein